MSLSIIRSNNRTDLERKEAFDILFKADKTVSRYFKYEDVKPYIDKILDRLRMTSKSRLNGCRFCPYALKCQYIYGFKSKTYPITQIGFNLHLCCEWFWNRITVEDFIQTSNLRKLIYENFMKLLPEWYLTDFIRFLCNSFINFEVNRINGIYKVLGKSRSVIQEYVFPICHEIGIENWDRWLTGFIDRIDRLSNDALAVIDYKFGKPKYYYGESNIPSWHKTGINTELGFYSILPQGKRVYALQEDNSLIPLKEHLGFKPEFYYGGMLFFQDIENTGYLFPITQSIITNTQKQINAFWNILDKGQFKCKPRSSCFDTPYRNCGFYWGNCEYNPRWMDIENCINMEVY